MAPTYHITTYGCQMNKNDSERIAGMLSSLGFTETADESGADIVFLNTCSVRQTAEDRIFGAQEKFLAYKKEKPNMIVAVTGCMPGRDKQKEFRRRLPATDLYFATRDMAHLPKWIAELRPDLANTGVMETDYLRWQPLRARSAQAYVTIQTGCNKFCSYCVVPSARGLEYNRPLRDIIDECRDLVARGVLEITLLGQTVNSYRAPDKEGYGFAELLGELNALDGLERLHWTAAHPISMSDDVIAALALPKQVNYLHLPVQSGNNDVLRRMNRKYTREQYLDIIAKVKAARPGIALGTDIIVGFSGETRAQFADTLSLYREVGFDISYNAQYSQRSGTLAAKMFPDDVAPEEKRERWDELQTLMEEITLAKNQMFVGKDVSVLVDAVERGVACGNSFEMKRVSFPCADASLVGKIVPVRVRDARTWVMEGDGL